MYGKGSLSCDFRECIVSGLCNVQKCFVFNSIAHDQCQIFGCCVMFSVLILSIQAIGCDKIRILTSYLFCFPVEHSGKAFHASPAVFCNGNRCIIVAFQHKGIQKILQIILFSFLKSQLHFRLGCGILRNLNIIIPRRVLQCHNTGKHLGCAGICQRTLPVLFIEYSAGLSVHEDC